MNLSSSDVQEISPAPSQVKLALLGFGNVGRALGHLLLAKRDLLRTRFGIQFRVVGIATLRHGMALKPEGIDLERALQIAGTGKSFADLSAGPPPEKASTLIQQSGADVLFELTPVDYESGQPAVDHIRAALREGMHAITANKGPVVHAYRELAELARSNGRSFLFESAVMDGAPIFSLWREALPAAELLSFRGVLNSTTNLILTLMEQGNSFDKAVAHAQEIGIAETDPSGDLLGWDAAIKVAALTTVLMGAPLKPDQVDRQGIDGISQELVEEAAAAGKRWKLICTANRDGDRVHASVGPQLIEPTDPLFEVMGTSSAITLKSDVLGPLTLMENDPGPHTTAYGLLADMISALGSGGPPKG